MCKNDTTSIFDAFLNYATKQSIYLHSANATKNSLPIAMIIFLLLQFRIAFEEIIVDP